MTTNSTLTRRRTQLTLLSSACDEHEPGRLTFDAAEESSPATIDVQLLSLQSDGLLIECVRREDALSPNSGRVRVYFGHHGRAYVFSAAVQRTLDLPPRGGQPRSGLKLSVPLCVQYRQEQRRPRVSVAQLPAVRVRLTGVCAPSWVLSGALRDISPGGVGLSMSPQTEIPALGETFRLSATLPDGFGELVLPVSLVHAERHADGLVFGLKFLAGDDGGALRESLRRLEAWQERASASAAPDASREDSQRNDAC